MMPAGLLGRFYATAGMAGTSSSWTRSPGNRLRSAGPFVTPITCTNIRQIQRDLPVSVRRLGCELPR
jgi:hypothetical protein